MRFIFLMRYSFFGKSDWRSAASRDANLLFNEERLRKRFYYFEKVALQSLRDQTNENFDLIVLGSKGMPEKHKNLLLEACNDTLGEKRAHVLFRAPDMAGNWFRRYNKKNLSDTDFRAQVILDDDDAVSSDFVETMRREALWAISDFNGPDPYVFLSQACGVSAVFKNNSLRLYNRNVASTALGLTLVSRSNSRRSPLFVAHKQLPIRHPIRVFHGQKPYYIRAIHDTNDSRAIVGDDPVDRSQLAKLEKRFPLLDALIADSPVEWNADTAVGDQLTKS